MYRHPWINDERSHEARVAAKKAISKVDQSKQVICLGCGSVTTKMELMAGESGFRRVGSAYYCRNCHGVMTRGESL